MSRLITLLFITSFSFGQGYDFQQLCLDCVEQNGFFCGDDPANWTQYAPNGCVPNGEGGLEYLNDGWEDCVDGSDENGAVPTTPEECGPPPQECDTIFEIEYIYETVIEYVDVIIYDTIIETEYIYNTDTVYADVLDTMFIDVIEYVEIFTQEYIDCATGLPCNTGIDEVLDKSKNTGLMYNLNGQHIRKPESIYIENGQIKKVL